MSALTLAPSDSLPPAPPYLERMNGGGEMPRLAYVADVNVQSTCHGSLQLFRLLSSYPAEKLLIIETTWNCSNPEQRLPGVRYVHHRPWWTDRKSVV